MDTRGTFNAGRADKKLATVEKIDRSKDRRQGKAISKMNAYKHGGRSAEVRDIQDMLTYYKHMFDSLV